MGESEFPGLKCVPGYLDTRHSASNEMDRYEAVFWEKNSCGMGDMLRFRNRLSINFVFKAADIAVIYALRIISGIVDIYMETV